MREKEVVTSLATAKRQSATLLANQDCAFQKQDVIERLLNGSYHNLFLESNIVTIIRTTPIITRTY